MFTVKQTQHLTVEETFVKFSDAHKYLGMERDQFDEEVLSQIEIVRAGDKQFVDAADLDRIAGEYVRKNGWPG